MSKIEVNQIGPQCGTTVTVGCGAGQTVAVDAATVNLGRSGGTVNLTCGATQSGFGRTGTVDWVTAIKTTGFTAVSGEGYFCNTTSAGFTVTFPAASVGNIISISDYGSTFGSNALVVSPNGTDKIGGVNGSAVLTTDGQSVTFVYADATKGWLIVQDSTETVTGGALVVASGGTITTCGDYKIHTFTGPGTFGVAQLSPSAPENAVDWTVVAGGGGGGASDGGGGGGAGGYRESPGTATGSYSVSPLAGNSAVTVTVSNYPITVGAGGTGAPVPGGGAVAGTNGGASAFSTYPSAGGGYGGVESGPGDRDGNTGGSGGGGMSGGGAVGCGAAGNTPPTSPAQGTAGGNAYGTSPPVHRTGGGGGGATAVGANAGDGCGGNGGTGATASIDGTPTQRSGGGGGGTRGATAGTATGGGGAGGVFPSIGTAGTDNTGGGGGGASFCGGSNGGSGVVILRYKYQ